VWLEYRDKVKLQFNGSDTKRTVCGRVYRQSETIKGKPATSRTPTFFARFEDNTVQPTRPSNKDCGLSFSVADVSKTFKRVNPRKAAGIPTRVLGACADKLAGVFTDIFNLYLSQSCFKMSTIVPLPKNEKVTEINHYRPEALISVMYL
jgi:hypothetical protein